MAKIAFLHHTFIAGSGIDGVIYEMASRLGKRGHEVMVMTLKDDHSYRGVPSLIFHSPVKNSRIDAVIEPLYKSTREIRHILTKFDIVATQLYPASVIPLFPCKLPIKSVVTEWGVQNVGGGLVNTAYTQMLRAMENYAVKRADIVLAGCDYTGRELRKKRPDAQTVYQYGINFNILNYSHYNRNELELKYPMIKDCRVLLFVGRNSPHKHIDVLVKMMRHILDRNVKLVVVGRQDFKSNQKYLEKLVDKFCLEDRVLFTGVVPKQEVIDWYCRCEMFVNASEWEGFLIPEAYAFRKPIVAFDVDAHREVVKTWQTGVLVKELTDKGYADVVNQLLNDKSLVSMMGDNGYRWAKENLDYDRIVDNWEKIVLAKENK